MLCCPFVFTFERFHFPRVEFRSTCIHDVDLVVEPPYNIRYCRSLQFPGLRSSSSFFLLPFPSEYLNPSSKSLPLCICFAGRSSCHSRVELSASTTVALINILKRRDFGSTTDTFPCQTTICQFMPMMTFGGDPVPLPRNHLIPLRVQSSSH